MSIVRATATPAHAPAAVFNALLAYSGDKAAAQAAIRGELFAAAEEAAHALNFKRIDGTLARLLNTENTGSVTKAELAAFEGGEAIPADKTTSKAYTLACTLRSIKAAATDFYKQDGQGAAARADAKLRTAYKHACAEAASQFAEQGMQALAAAEEANKVIRSIKADNRKLLKQEEAAKAAAQAQAQAPAPQATPSAAQVAIFDAVALIAAVKAGDKQAIATAKQIAAALAA